MTIQDNQNRRDKLPLLAITDYEHPWDQAARTALEQMPGFTAIVSKLNQIGFERLIRIHYTGSNLKVTAQGFPMLSEALNQACDILSIEQYPELYIQPGFGINAFTTGVEKTTIVLNAGCIDLLTPQELSFVLAHELGHIKSRHVLYYQAASFLPTIAQFANPFGIGTLLTGAVQLTLQHWARMSELTADRVGLLGCQDLEAAITTLVKMSGLPQSYYSTKVINDFMQQAREFESYDYDALDQIAKVMGVMNQSHPWTVMRATELLKWIESGAYEQILKKQDWRQLPPSTSAWRFG